MKQENIDVAARKAKRKREAVCGIVLFGVLQLATALCFGSLCLIPDLPKGVCVLFLVLAAVCVLLLIPALVVLRQRFQEIEGGELDEAGQY